MSAPRHLVLIGLMGAGKTTVGQRCAHRLGREFVDTDAVIVANAGGSIPDIFATEGEAGFRARERTAVAEVLASPEALVVACGGGVASDPANRATLRGSGYVVWLRATPDVLAARVEADGVDARPLLSGGPTTATLSRLADARRDAYAAAADVSVDTDGLDVDAVTAEVLDAWAGASQ